MNRISTARKKLSELAVSRPKLSTGVKVFLILGIVLLPFAILSAIASNASAQRAEFERQARLGVILDGMARRIASGLLDDLSTLTTMADRQIEIYETRDIACREAGDVIRSRHRGVVHFAVSDSVGNSLCQAQWAGPLPVVPGVFGERQTRSTIVGEATLEVNRTIQTGRAIAIRYPSRLIAEFAASPDLTSPHTIELVQNERRLLIADKGGRAFSIGGSTRIEQPIGNFGLTLRLTNLNPPPTTAQLTSALLPVAMWLVSALIGWILVDRLFTSDLRRLTREIASYEPGDVIPVPKPSVQTASEVRALGTGLNAMSELVASNLGEIHEGLERQTALTREVHHRVKNNLQVVSSLINLHARGEHALDAKGAYRLIQRRVDALSVVHRNHFAGYEESHGVSLRTLLSELAGLLQASSQSEPWPIEVRLDVGSGAVNQDTAISVAFLTTELTELALYSARKPTELLIQIENSSSGHAELNFWAVGFQDGPELKRQLEDQYLRILTGLSRQLRSPLEHDSKTGRFSIKVTLIPLIATN